MKKIAIVIVLFCTLYSAYSLDYRQVIFGNNYQNIIEIDADTFFKQYPAVKENYRAGERYRGIDEENKSGSSSDYYHVYEQVIGETTFYRVLFNNERPVGTYDYENKKLTATDFLNWRKIYFTQYVFFKKSDTDLLQLGDGYEFGRISPNMVSDNPKYDGLEIIERNNQVIGVMGYTIHESYHMESPESGWRYIESWASYCLWSDIVKYQETKVPTISYTNWQDNPSIPNILIKSYNDPYTHGESDTLLDSKRPFMYSIQNAFDGNPATSYVEDTNNDMFRLTISGAIKEPTSYKIINGYGSNDYYYQNNQISKIDINPDGSNGDFQLKETLEPQIITFDAIGSNTIHMAVEEITKGTMYSDTCLAEFDVYIEGLGWLFGGEQYHDNVIKATDNADDYLFTVKENGTAEITGYEGSATDLNIPSTVEKNGQLYSVTSIGQSAFESGSITSVIIPDSVTSIGSYAFNGCYSLVFVKIPDSVTSIGSYAFRKCNYLISIRIPDSVTSIGNWVFPGNRYEGYRFLELSVSEGSYALEYAKENGITYTLEKTEEGADGNYLFNIVDETAEIVRYTGLDIEVSIPSSLKHQGKSYPVTVIGYAAFFRNNSLTSITIPNSVTSIGELAFYRSALTFITIPNSVISIGSGAFSECENLTAITIPSSVTSIGYGAFRKNLTLSVFTDSYALEYAKENNIPYVLVEGE